MIATVDRVAGYRGYSAPTLGWLRERRQERGDRTRRAEPRAVGEAHGLLLAGVVLARTATHGTVPIPSSTTPEHVVANAGAVDTWLDDGTIPRIGALGVPTFRLVR
jgi:diketogulonate reductase-like aldo/keto reductase